jgi:hypothetical protein
LSRWFLNLSAMIGVWKHFWSLIFDIRILNERFNNFEGETLISSSFLLWYICHCQTDIIS